MKVTEKNLRELALLSENERTILSAYIDLRSGWDNAYDKLKKSIERMRPLLVGEETDYYDLSVSLLQDYFNKEKDKKFGGYGLAYFVDIGSDYSKGFKLYCPTEDLFAINDEAIIAPLALQMDEYETVGIIMADNSGARILTISGYRIKQEDSIKTKIHHLSKVGGWSQMRYQRRRDNEIEEFVKEIVAMTESTFRSERIGRFIIAGRKPLLQMIINEFPHKWKELEIETIKWDLDASDEEFLKKAKPLLDKMERNEEHDTLEVLLAELRRGGLAVSGPEKTLVALHLGQVDTVVIDTSIPSEIKEELVSIANTTSSKVEFVPPGNEILKKLNGVGALLRYKF
ncbi:hypothetical protein KAH81_05660 [bacterium]|nr:hypothetical protein [bacterium]